MKTTATPARPPPVPAPGASTAKAAASTKRAPLGGTLGAATTRSTAAGGATRGSSATRKGARSASAGAADDERDEYMTNLKGQIYLLTLENELLKQSRDGGAAGGASTNAAAGAGGGSLSSMYAQGAAAAAAREAAAAGGATGSAGSGLDYAPFASGNLDDLTDLEIAMRHKFQALETKYARDLADARKAAEALSTQCAAQSSLVAALKQELAFSQEIIAQGKALVHTTEETLGAELQRTRDRVAHLEGEVAEQKRITGTVREEVAARDAVIADLAARLPVETEAHVASDVARAKTLAAYARMYTAVRVFAKNWRVERVKRQTADAAIEALRSARDSAEARADAAEAEAAVARAAQAEALATRDEALSAARALRSRVEVLELTLQRSQAEAESRAVAVEEGQVALEAALARGDVAESAAHTAEEAAAGARARAAAIQETCTKLKTALGESEHRVEEAVAAKAEALTRLGEVEDLLAAAHGRLAAYEHEIEESAARIAALEVGVAAERDQRILTEARAARAEEELARRPSVEVLKALDVGSLMQRNLEAAAAMSSLLALAGAADPGGAQ